MQSYDVDVEKEYAIRGNSVVLKCKVASFVADFVSVIAWEDSEGNKFYPTNDYGIMFVEILIHYERILGMHLSFQFHSSRISRICRGKYLL